MNHFISMKDFSKNEILEILKRANYLDSTPERNLCRENIVSTLFFEPSTRTRLSFVTAAYKLGAPVHGFDSPSGTSLQKGESLRDTIKMAESYCDTIVIRHPKDGSARFAADISKVPVINGGDGANEHPSQTLLDLYTIQKEQESLENIKIAFLGDLKYGRTVHSLTKALSLFNAEFYFIAAPEIQIPDYLLEELREKGIKYQLLDNFQEIVKKVDVLYVTRVQKERFQDFSVYEKVKNNYILKAENLRNAKDNLIVMHPLPRVNEIALDVDDTKFAKYFQQAANGVPVREAIISLALEKFPFSREEKVQEEILKNSKSLCQNNNCISNSEETDNKIVHHHGRDFCYYCRREIKDVNR
ncbi:MAG: aspartate carbamoyltransferase [Fusobacteriaceae bacterium]